jgi:hypothetical protein
MAQARARVCFEFAGRLFLIGRTRIGYAMRALTSREVSLLEPFPSLAAAQQMCRAVGRAQVLAFADEERPQADARQPRTRHAERSRREMWEPASLVPTSARSPAPPPRRSVEEAPRASAHPMSRRASAADHRPDPATAAELATVIHQLEAGT